MRSGQFLHTGQYGKAEDFKGIDYRLRLAGLQRDFHAAIPQPLSNIYALLNGLNGHLITIM